MAETTIASLQNELRQLRQELYAIRDLLSHIPMRDDMHGSEISFLRTARAANGYLGRLDDLLTHTSECNSWGNSDRYITDDESTAGVAERNPRFVAHRIQSWVVDPSSARAAKRKEYLRINSDETTGVYSGWAY